MTNRPSIAWMPLVLVAACSISPAQHPPELVLPPRAPDARTGSQLALRMQAVPLAEREQLLLHAYASGNVPTFLRSMVPVTTTAMIQGQLRTATFWCLPDYIGIGRDDDWLRTPMTPGLAQLLCDRLDATLPTRRMSDAIWTQASLQLPPFPFSPTIYNIQSVPVFEQHHQQVEAQLQSAPSRLLTAGHKKDVVISALLQNFPTRVCIYGWHQTNGAAIQPLSKVHSQSYVDYSHGIRLVAKRVEIDGTPTTVAAVLADPVLHPLLSDEGAFASSRYTPHEDVSLPVHERFPVSGPVHPAWRSKFVAPTSISAATLPAGTSPPSGDSHVLRIWDPVGGTDSLRVELGAVRDVGFEAALLCDYRPQLANIGFERIGVFVRDRANGAFDGTLSQNGACYALTWDSHDGRVRCLRCAGGQLLDLLPTARYASGTQWRRFRIDARGTELRFHLDDELLLTTNDATHVEGAIGIGYHEYFSNNSWMRGTRVDSCHADVPGAFHAALRAGSAVGEIVLSRTRGRPSDFYLHAFTVTPGAFPNGWFFGLDPQLPVLAGQIASAQPAFVGWLNPNGASDLAVAGLPIGLPLQSVALELTPGGKLVAASRPVATVVR
ncbi:MAG: hypothetical protein AB8H80_09335 [Planctomycetota bacterium]